MRFECSFLKRARQALQRSRCYWGMSIASLAVFTVLAGAKAVWANDGERSQHSPSAAIEHKIEQYLKAEIARENSAFTGVQVRVKLPSLPKSQAVFNESCKDINLSGERPPKGWISIKGEREFKLNCKAEDIIIVAAHVELLQYQWVASRVLERGELLSAADVNQVLRPLSPQRLAPSHVIGLSVARRLRQGQVIQHAHLKLPVAIVRGQKVNLFAQDGVVKTLLEGEAVSEGAIGERIRVRNTKSRAVVEGIIRDSKTVEVLL